MDRGSSFGASLAPAAIVLALGLAHCGLRRVDAVDGVPVAANAPGITVAPAVALSWPNATSTSNSDPWIVEHHDDIVEMRPRVLVLQFYNGIDAQQGEAIAQAQIDAIAESSRFHGYADSTAPAFLIYDLLKVVDLTDQPPPPFWQYVSSTKLPTDSTGAFDTSALFTQGFAANYGYPDPTSPARYLTLCELFEKGVINELWLAVGEEGARAPGLMMESKQVYDAQNQPVANKFEPCTGYACFPAPHCGVTVRIAHLSPTQSPSCDLIVRSTGIENTRLAIPYLQANALDFINHDFSTVAGTRFDSFEDLCGMQQTTCVDYPNAAVAEGTYSDGTRWRIDPFIQGCGTSHFPANGRYRWDYENTQSVHSRCEHYGMHDGANGQDALDSYSSTKVTAYDQLYGSDCGGGWQVYFRQNMPGLHNAARAADGSPMKNWWPFLFY